MHLLTCRCRSSESGLLNCKSNAEMVACMTAKVVSSGHFQTYCYNAVAFALILPGLLHTYKSHRPTQHSQAASLTEAPLVTSNDVGFSVLIYSITFRKICRTKQHRF